MDYTIYDIDYGGNYLVQKRQNVRELGKRQTLKIRSHVRKNIKDRELIT